MGDVPTWAGNSLIILLHENLEGIQKQGCVRYARSLVFRLLLASGCFVPGDNEKARHMTFVLVILLATENHPALLRFAP